MRGFRSKFVFLLIVYFAGFITAIYTIAPVPDSENPGLTEHNSAWSTWKSDEFARQLNSRVHQCIDFIKEKGCQAGEYIKEKINEHRENL